MPSGGNRDRGPALIAIYWVECLVALTIIFLRLYARIKIRGLGPDDWMMFVTMVIEK